MLSPAERSDEHRAPGGLFPQKRMLQVNADSLQKLKAATIAKTEYDGVA